MKLISIAHIGLACDYHRIFIPASLFSQKIQRGTLDDTDAIFLNRETSFVDVEQYKKKGVKIIIDIDDYWELPKYHYLHKMYKEDTGKKIVKNLKLADVVFTTNEFLASKVRPLNKNVEVFPNALPKLAQFTPNKAQGEHVLYTGGSSHFEDLKLIRYAKIDNFAMVGDNNDKEFVRMKSLFGSTKITLIPRRDLNTYMEVYKEAKLSLAPLVNDDFTCSKSNLKILEAAVYGLPIICSPVYPYLENNPPVMYANTTKEWSDHIANPADIGEELRQWADEFYNFEKINKEREDCILSLI